MINVILCLAGLIILRRNVMKYVKQNTHNHALNIYLYEYYIKIYLNQ
jgi:hypothetical protein